MFIQFYDHQTEIDFLFETCTSKKELNLSLNGTSLLAKVPARRVKSIFRLLGNNYGLV